MPKNYDKFMDRGYDSGEIHIYAKKLLKLFNTFLESVEYDNIDLEMIRY